MDRRIFLSSLLGSSLAVAILPYPLRAEPRQLEGFGGPKIKWQKNLRSAQKLAVQQNKPIMIVFGASWCTYCHKLEKETLNDRRTAAKIERDFVPVHLDYDQDQKIAKILEVERLPCVVVISPEADLLARNEGFVESKDFQEFLKSALDRKADIQQVRAPGNRD